MMFYLSCAAVPRQVDWHTHICFQHGREKVHPADSELLNHALLLLRNLIHTSPDDSQTLETSITLQSMLR